MSATPAASPPRGAAHIADPGKQYRAEAGIPIVPAMDGFRSLAILGLVALHVQAVTLIPASEGVRQAIGSMGRDIVSVLFVLSGFVVFLPTVARGGKFGSVGSFFIRRGARLLPAYWIALAIAFVLVVAWPVFDQPVPGLSDIAVNVAALQSPAHMFDPGSGFFLYGFGINGALWTLSLEITFYLLLPLVAVAYARRPFIGLGIAALITLGWYLGFDHLAGIVDLLGLNVSAATIADLHGASANQFPSFAFHFACGMTGAWIFVRLCSRRAQGNLERLGGRAQAIALLALLTCAAALGYLATTTQVPLLSEALTLLYAASLASFMVATALAPKARQVPFALPRVRRTGDISYGIYLIHVPLIVYLLEVLDPRANTLAGVLEIAVPVIGLATFYGYLSARFVEQPIRRWAHRFGARASTTTAQAGVARAPRPPVAPRG
ncbi:MAG: acyltransferase [Solirubrobacterales bacterium]|nr:acyltransferase [Solirubrobacterales bacterium]